MVVPPNPRQPASFRRIATPRQADSTIKNSCADNLLAHYRRDDAAGLKPCPGGRPPAAALRGLDPRHPPGVGAARDRRCKTACGTGRRPSNSPGKHPWVLLGGGRPRGRGGEGRPGGATRPRAALPGGEAALMGGEGQALSPLSRSAQQGALRIFAVPVIAR